MGLPTDYKERKAIPLCTGVLDYFPDALAAVAEVSRIGNDQHNPGQPLHWAREKSSDHPDCALRHIAERGKRDTDGGRHTAKAAWRILAMLQLEIEAERGSAEMGRLWLPSIAGEISPGIDASGIPFKSSDDRGRLRLPDVNLQAKPRMG